MVENDAAPYVERHNAGEALATAKTEMDWRPVLRRLVAGDDQNGRLAVELLAYLEPNTFEPPFIAEILVGYRATITLSCFL
ncbi:MAG: hypothetical protein RB191_11065 [Terriglobia bacterium]|nr:hypothetical protein [Terriglobia bacterium]